MILEEEIRNAEQGSIGAMCRIGDYYYQKIRNEGYENEYENMALKYYKMAAEREELYGMYRFIEIGNISGESRTFVCLSNWYTNSNETVWRSL